jgi:hypothetical protein
MERHSLYNDEVVMHYYDDDHKYVWNGEHLPSSTQITGILDKPALRYWYVNQALERVKNKVSPGVAYDEVELSQILEKAKYGAKDSRDKSASIGRLVHGWIEDYITNQINDKGEKPPLPMHTGACNSIKSFLEWEEKADPQYIYNERRMLSRVHRFCGTLDIAALIDGQPTIVDIKTGKRVYPEHWLQTASYCLMLEEEQPNDWQYRLEDMDRIILLISQELGTMKPTRAKSDILADADVFTSLRYVYRWKEGK